MDQSVKQFYDYSIHRALGKQRETKEVAQGRVVYVCSCPQCPGVSPAGQRVAVPTAPDWRPACVRVLNLTQEVWVDLKRPRLKVPGQASGYLHRGSCENVC